ncbi:ankyrin repeat-containing protein [Anaplasma platys]|uniref:Ankyrin repeat-containing protein n=1 Tax=Anaplasma platys TaxID=949 RepID=A0A858PY96_9RICK|nr:ankyrin repeat-containing protein [Anaplasma platys]
MPSKTGVKPSVNDSQRENIQYAKEAWEDFARAFVRANAHFAMNIPQGDNATVIRLAREISDAYSRITLEDYEPSLERSKLGNEVKNIFKKNQVPCREITSRIFNIRNGVISNPYLDLRFSSPFGFGRAVDGMILNSLQNIQEISSRSGVDVEFDMEISDLPLLPNATDAIKRNPGDVELPTLGIGQTSPISTTDSKRLLLSIANMSRPISRPQVAATTHENQEEKGTSFTATLGRFNQALNQREGTDISKEARKKPEPQKLLSDAQREVLHDMLLAISRERDNQPDIQFSGKEGAIKGISGSIKTQTEYGKSAFIESVEGKFRTERAPQHYDIQDNKPKLDAQSAIMAENFHNSLHHSIMPLKEMASNMRDMLNKVANGGKYSEECSWALLNKACTDAGLNFAFDSANRRDLNNVGLQVYALYMVHARAESDSQTLANDLKSKLPSILTQNNIRYVDAGNSPLTIKDGIITENNRVPENFCSKLGYGEAMDASIRNAAAYMGKIAEKASLSHTTVIDRQDLLRLPAATAQINGKHGAYNGRYFDFNDPLPIPQEEGRILLNHINNMLCLKEAPTIEPIADSREIAAQDAVKAMANRSSKEISSGNETSTRAQTTHGTATPKDMLKKAARIAEEIKAAFVPNESHINVEDEGIAQPGRSSKENSTEHSQFSESDSLNPELLEQLKQKLKRCVHMEGVQHSEEKGSVAGHFGHKTSETARKTGSGQSR